ncbi:MAG TPA: glycosyltransferase, partial [Thermoanaerobacterales bacterium]|nr:glycosyltransferase [Thermoanaerobacterales bacterium]
VAALHTIYKTLVYKSDAIQYLTEDERKNSYVKHNSIIVPNGTLIPEKLELEKDKVKNISFVYIGRKDIHIKGIDILLEAFSLAANVMRASSATLTLYGPDRKGSFTEIDKIISKYKIDDFVCNKDGVFDEEKEKTLKNSTVFVQTSRTEGHPIGLIEACAHGLPVLVTPGTSVSKEVQSFNCGWVASLSGESIANQIVHIINNKAEIPKRSRNAINYVSKLYNWDIVAKSAINQYKSVIENYHKK